MRPVNHRFGRASPRFRPPGFPPSLRLRRPSARNSQSPKFDGAASELTIARARTFPMKDARERVAAPDCPSNLLLQVRRLNGAHPIGRCAIAPPHGFEMLTLLERHRWLPHARPRLLATYAGSGRQPAMHTPGIDAISPHTGQRRHPIWTDRQSAVSMLIDPLSRAGPDGPRLRETVAGSRAVAWDDDVGPAVGTDRRRSLRSASAGPFLRHRQPRL